MKCVNIRIDSGLIQFDCPHCGLYGELDDELVELLWAKSSGRVRCPLPKGCGKLYGIPSVEEVQGHKSTAGTIPGSKTITSPNKLSDPVTSSSGNAVSSKTFERYEGRSEAFKSVVGLALEENSALRWEGEEVTPGWLASHPEEAIIISETKLPEWHVRLRRDKWLLEEAEKIRRICADKGLKHAALTEAVRLMLDENDPLRWKDNEVTLGWLVLHPEEAIRISETKLPEWYAQLRNEKWLQAKAVQIRAACRNELLEGVGLTVVVGRILDGESELRWAGAVVGPHWWSENSQQGADLLQAISPAWTKLIQPRDLHLPEDKADFLREVCAEMSTLLTQKEFRSVLLLVLDDQSPLEWYGRKKTGETVTLDWIRNNREEALKLRLSPLMQWYKRWYREQGQTPPLIRENPSPMMEEDEGGKPPKLQSGYPLDESLEEIYSWSLAEKQHLLHVCPQCGARGTTGPKGGWRCAECGVRTERSSLYDQQYEKQYENVSGELPHNPQDQQDTENLNYFDKQFTNTGYLGWFLLSFFCCGLVVVISFLGILLCKDPDAREKAKIVFGVSLVILIIYIIAQNSS